MSDTPTWRERLDLIAAPPVRPVLRIAGLTAVAVAVAAGGWFLLRPPGGPPPEATLPRARPATATTAPAELVVDAAGAVQSPGVYRLPAGSRIGDLVGAAGGAADDADLDKVNLAAPLSDGQRVYVPRQGEAVPASAGEADGPLNLNTATVDQLDTLPGVGPATARAIVEARTRKGRFTSVDDLLGVRGIGPAKLDALRDLVTV